MHNRNHDRNHGTHNGDCMIAQAVAGLPVGLLLTDPSGKVTWLNHKAERLLGMPAAQCVGRLITHVLKDPQLASFWQAARTGEGVGTGEVSVHWPQPMELKVSVSKCEDGGAAEVGRALLFCDVTAEHTVQVELSRAVANRLLALTAGHMPPQVVASLTQQEIRILRLVGRGISNESISTEVGVSSSTVRSHLKSLYRKLGLSSRAGAVRFAIQNNLA